MFDRTYRLIDIARQIDRDKSTIIRWEEMGLIPKALRDSRGWRYYSAADAKKIVQLAKDTNYFRNVDKVTELNGGTRPPRMVYIGTFIGILVILSQLFMTGLRYTRAANEEVYATVSAGVLSILNSSSSGSFDAAVSVLFTSQTSALTDFGSIELSDARGSGAGWTLNMTATDWSEVNNSAPGGRHNQLDYDSTGLDGNLGKMCVITTTGAIRSQAGQDTTSITKGTSDCYSAGVTTIDWYTAAGTFGQGQYWITDFDLEQFIPSSPTAQNLTSTITLTLT
ncbi:MAG: MerR family transcriptional regulator [Patescibacteria group bacterium]